MPEALSAFPSDVAPVMPAPVFGPVEPGERIALIDALRGLALFGIIAANMRGFAGPLTSYFRPDLLWNTRSDVWVQAFVDTFIQGKFITLFAFLFGVGFALQFSRAEARLSRFVPTYRRRLFALILFGILHQVLFWWGDVLVTYGLGGFLLMLFRKRQNKTVLTWALLLLLLPCAVISGSLLFRQIRPLSPQRVEQVRLRAARAKLDAQDEVRRAVQVYQSGTYVQVFRQRLEEVKQEAASQGGAVMLTFPIFLLGLWVFRQGIFQDPQRHRERLQKGLWLGLLLGIPANAAATWFQHASGGQMSMANPRPSMVLVGLLIFFGRPLLSLGYGCAVALLFLDGRWRRILVPFGAIGRTALTNYLLQSIVCTTIFNSYGGGLFGRMHLASLFVLSIAIYALQLPLSMWWLSRYRFGPAEWLWRAATYGKLPAMRQETVVATV